MSTTTRRTITLTGRPPVTIQEDAWPLIARASDKEWDNQYECQANRISKWFIGVRQHEDGRALVYATYSYMNNWQGARDYAAKSGLLLSSADGSVADQVICDAINEVCTDISRAEHNGNDAERWPTLAAECIADMPAEEI